MLIFGVSLVRFAHMIIRLVDKQSEIDGREEGVSKKNTILCMLT